MLALFMPYKESTPKSSAILTDSGHTPSEPLLQPLSAGRDSTTIDTMNPDICQPSHLVEALSSFDDSRIPDSPHPRLLIERKHLPGLPELPTLPTARLNQPTKSVKYPKTTNSCGRRSIFGHMARRETNERAIPDTIDETSPMASSLFRMPSQHLACRREYYRDASTFDSSQYLLPTLPSPLQRYYKGGARTPLQGMYPLQAAKPVLKRPPKLPDKSIDTTDTSQETSSDEDGSLRHAHDTARDALQLGHGTDEPDSIASSSSSASLQERKVRWDPRVTVTEYQDRIRREWYSDQELENFKLEAVRLARSYLIQHPHLVPEYNEAKLDPITQTMRKKALFSLPALTLDGEDVDDDDQEREHEQIARDHVQHILIIEPNVVISDLLRRSFCALYPWAQIVEASSAGDVIETIHDGTFCFDIVLCEERLEHHSTNRDFYSCDEHNLAHFKKSMSLYAHRPQLTKITPCKNGSDFFQVLSRHSDERQRRPLCIGLTGHYDHDKATIEASGADIVWQKPPPPMTLDLRCCLVAALAEKRGHMPMNAAASKQD